MPQIEIDDQVYRILAEKSVPFELPNDTLARLLGIKVTAKPPKGDGHDSVRFQALPKSHSGRQRKTNLYELKQAGFLKEGQVLYLHDYHGNRINGAESTLKGLRLSYNTRSYSMSELAAKLLKEKAGHRGGIVRGPIHWYTQNGDSVSELWNKYLDKK